jgi:hypothetical protein
MPLVNRGALPSTLLHAISYRGALLSTLLHAIIYGGALLSTLLHVTSYRGALLSTLLHATVYMYLHNLLKVLVQIANKMGLHKKKSCHMTDNCSVSLRTWRSAAAVARIATEEPILV